MSAFFLCVMLKFRYIEVFEDNQGAISLVSVKTGVEFEHDTRRCESPVIEITRVLRRFLLPT